MSPGPLSPFRLKPRVRAMALLAVWALIAVIQSGAPASFRGSDRSDLAAVTDPASHVSASLFDDIGHILAPQTCDPTLEQVTGSVTVGDGSTPIGPNFSLWYAAPGLAGYGANMGYFPWGTATVTPPWNYTDGAFTAIGDGPYQIPLGSGYFHCERDTQGCRICSGHFDIKLYAIFHLLSRPALEPDCLRLGRPNGHPIRPDSVAVSL